jgi:hypothetical protein
MRRFWANWGFYSFGISSPTLDVHLSGNGSTIFIFRSVYGRRREAQCQICGQALRLKIIRRKVCPFNFRRRLCYTSSGLASDHSPDRRHRRRTTRVRSRILTRSPHPRVATSRSSSPRNRDLRQRPSSGVTFVLLLLGMKRPQRNDSSSRRGGRYDIAILHLLYAHGDVWARPRRRVVPPTDVPPPSIFIPPRNLRWDGLVLSALSDPREQNAPIACSTATANVPR